MKKSGKLKNLEVKFLITSAIAVKLDSPSLVPKSASVLPCSPDTTSHMLGRDSLRFWRPVVFGCDN
jgi:hypothetical protein